MTISAELRHEKNSKQLRARGRVPGVLYGKNIPVTPIDLDASALKKEMERSSGLLDVRVAGKPYRVLVRQLQKNAIKGDLLHVDLFAVSLNEDLDVNIPVVLVGEAAGIKEGGVLQHVTHSVTIRCKPDKIPSELSVDVSELGMGDSLLLTDVISKLPFEVISDHATVLVTVSTPTVEEEPPAAETESLETSPEE